MRKFLAVFGLIMIAFGFVGCQDDTTSVATTTATTTLQSTTTTTLGSTTTAATTTAATTTATTTEMSDQAIVDQLFDELNLGDLTALTGSSPRLIMPVTRNDVTISWVISNTSYIATNGVITQPEHETGNQVVTLTATLTLGDVTRDKVFTATVLALPSPEDTEPIIFETFSDYSDGSIIPQTTSGIWGPVSGKTGNSEFYIVSEIPDTTIPLDSKALSIKAHSELQVEAALVHSYGLIIVEADVYQTANGSPLYLQSSSSSPVIGFGMTGGDSGNGNVYYRTDNGDMISTAVELNTWYTIRLEVNLDNKTIEFFYYDFEGNLIPVTPGPVAYVGITAFTSLFIRSGSSTTMTLNENPTYITNIVANRVEALPRPVDPIRLGVVTGIESAVILENGSTFTPSIPVVKNFYGSQATLTESTDYSLVIDNPVDINVDDEYTVTYTLTNLNNASDIKVITQTVTVYSPIQPNVINSVTSTVIPAFETETDLTVHLMRAEGTLLYVLSETPLTGEEIVLSASKVSVLIDNTTMVIENVMVGETEKVYFVVDLNGMSNVIEHEVVRQTIVSIATPQQFFDTLSVNVLPGNYYILANDIDFTGFTWTVSATNKFQATLDGQGYTVSNLTINKIGVRGGIFSDLENAVLKNLVFDNIITTSDTAGSGLIVGESRGITLLDNIVVMNSSNIVDLASGTDVYGAILVSRLRGGSLTISNISVIDTYVESTMHYGGGLVGGTEAGTTITMEDIYMNNFDVRESTDISAVGKIVGGIIGRVRGIASIERVVGYNVSVTGKNNVGAAIGKIDTESTSVTLKDIYLQGTITSPVDKLNIYAGLISGATPVAENLWASDFGTAGTTGLGVEEGNLIEISLTQVETWWTTNIPSIITSDLWGFVIDKPMLDNLSTLS